MNSQPFMTQIKWFLRILAVAAVYFFSATFSLSLAFHNTNASPVWPPSAIGFTAVLIFGYRVAPGIFLGAFFANVFTIMINHTADPFTIGVSSAAIGLGNTLEAVCGTFLLQRLIGQRNPLDRTQDILKFILVAILMCLVSAMIGPTILCLAGIVPLSIYNITLFTWWLGDFTGILTLTPLFLLRYKRSLIPWASWRAVEYFIFLIFLLVVVMSIFGGQTRLSVLQYPLDYLLLPAIVWAAYRFGQTGVGLSMLPIATLTIAGTINGFGPFVRETRNESLLLLQAFIAVITLTGLILAAALNERRRAEKELKCSQQELNDFIENAPVGLHWVGRDERILWANQAELDLLGYQKDEFIGHPIAEFYVDQPVIQDILTRLSNHEVLQDYEAQLRCKDGSIKYALISSNVLWEDGKFIHTRSFTRDITERKIAEENEKTLKDKLVSEKAKLEQVLSFEEELNSITDLNRLIDLIVEKTTRILESNKCALQFLDENTGELCLKGHKGLEDAIIEQSQQQKIDPIAGQAAKEKKALLVKNIETDERFMDGTKPLAGGNSFMMAPIQLDHRFIGTLSISDKNSLEGDVFSENDLKILHMIVRQVAVGLESAQLYREIKYLSIVDQPTNIYNHHYFLNILDYEIRRVKRYSRKLCLLMVDLDDFKVYVNNFGSREGDLLLKKVADVLKHSTRDIDIVCRYATDQFTIILPETQVSEATIVAEKIRKNILDATFEKKVTLSIGTVQLGDRVGLYEFIQKANMALKEAKNKGKNMVYALD